MDAFAVSVCKGLGMHRVNYAHALVIALFFGVFQGLMPVIGWLVGSAFAVYVTAVDHWIAFALLAFVGVVVGNRFGARFEKPSQIAGGIVLIAIGLKILLEHLGLIAF